VVALQATNELSKVKTYIKKHFQADELECLDMMIDASYSAKMMIPNIESFSSYLFKVIDDHEVDEVTLYKKAQIDRRLFSKIRSDETYQPSKKTVFKFVLALELSYKEAKECLEHAGFAFSRSSKFDLIVEYAVKHQLYNIFEVNEFLEELTGETL